MRVTIKSGFVVLFAGGTAADVEYHSSCLLGRKQERTNSCLFIPPLGRRRGEKNAQTQRMCRNLMFECASKYINTKKYPTP